ncbi:MAG: DeoR/GlpR family DNA-binding transcription regulator [Eubacteriales bacterium]|nr:DeoR/GlpR family DNA-binding transcription regulator [Eubacteriales bacterium]
MLAVERRNLILEKLHEEKRVVVSNLSKLYAVSEETIRRDLDKLEQEGLVIKSYGGAIINESTSIDVPFNVRKNRNVVGKQKVADLVASLIQEGDHLMLDASTTSVFVAKALKTIENLTVVTNSIENLIELSDMTKWTVLSTGGKLKGEYLSLFGTKTEEGLASYSVDKAIISCKAFDLERGFFDSQEEFSSAKRAMMRSAREVILVVDSSKFDQQSFAKIGDLKDITMIVTDKRPKAVWMEKFAQAGVACIYPEGVR